MPKLALRVPAAGAIILTTLLCAPRMFEVVGPVRLFAFDSRTREDLILTQWVGTLTMPGYAVLFALSPPVTS